MKKLNLQSGCGGVVKRLGLSTLWLAAVQILSCLASFAVLICAFGRAFSLEWMIYGLGILFPFLWGMGGYWCPEKFRPEDRRQAGLLRSCPLRYVSGPPKAGQRFCGSPCFPS